MKYVIMMAMLGALLLGGCGMMSDPDCETAKTMTEDFFFRMQQDEAFAQRLWFWVDAPYPKQSFQKGALFIDANGVKLMAAPSSEFTSGAYQGGGIGAWIPVEKGESIREWFDRWACQVDGPRMPRMSLHCPVPRGMYGKPEAAGIAEKCALAEARAAYGGKRTKDAIATCGWFQSGWWKDVDRDADGMPIKVGEIYPWPLGAGPRPPFDTADDAARVKFNVLAQAGKRPVVQRAITAVRARVIEQAWQRSQLDCPNQGKPGNAAPVPPGATGVDGGGVDIPPGTTPGGSSPGGGDYP